jgi:hypothetical protein
MTRPYYNTYLTDGTTYALIEATLFEGISDVNLKDHKEKWLPLLLGARQEANARPAQGQHVARVEDAHWDWSRKVKTYRVSLSHRHFAVECAADTQGLMQLELTHRSRIDPGQHLIYIDLLSVAPWNRKKLVERPRLIGVGSVLFTQAVGTSLEEGFSGRVGLHSLPTSADWYRKQRMQSFGPDPAYPSGLEYFEMSPDEAEKHIQRVSE